MATPVARSIVRRESKRVFSGVMVLDLFFGLLFVEKQLALNHFVNE